MIVSQIFKNYRAGKQCDRIEDARTVKYSVLELNLIHFQADFIGKLTKVAPTDRLSCKEMADELYIA